MLALMEKGVPYEAAVKMPLELGLRIMAQKGLVLIDPDEVKKTDDGRILGYIPEDDEVEGVRQIPLKELVREMKIPKKEP